jgi:hypothetical protein
VDFFTRPKPIESGDFSNSLNHRYYRGVAQSGSASALGAEGRVFESRRPDHRERSGPPTSGGALEASHGEVMLARIFRPSKSAMQSGNARSKEWMLEFAPASARLPDPLMGWTLSTDMNGQVRLAFDTMEEAVDYAGRHGIAFELLTEPKRRKIVKAYADNFAFSRKEPWTH